MRALLSPQASNSALEDEKQRTTALLGRQMNLIGILMERGGGGADGGVNRVSSGSGSGSGTVRRAAVPLGETPHTARGAPARLQGWGLHFYPRGLHAHAAF